MTQKYLRKNKIIQEIWKAGEESPENTPWD